MPLSTFLIFMLAGQSCTFRKQDSTDDLTTAIFADEEKGQDKVQGQQTDEIFKTSSVPVYKSTLTSEHVAKYGGKLKVQAFGDVHGSWYVNGKRSEAGSGLNAFRDSTLGRSIKNGDGSVLIFVGDMSTLEPDPDVNSGKPCAPCTQLQSDEIKAFAEWFGSLKQYPVKIAMPGNHDTCFDKRKVLNSYVTPALTGLEELFRGQGIHFLSGDTGGVVKVKLKKVFGRTQGITIAGIGISQARTLSCDGAFQYPGESKPANLSGKWLAWEEKCGDECADEHYKQANEAVLTNVKELYKQSKNKIDVLLMHGPPDSPPDDDRASIQKNPSSALVKLVKKIKPTYFITGHVHGNCRQMAFGEEYKHKGLSVRNVAVKFADPTDPEPELPQRRFNFVLPEWFLERHAL